MKIKALIIATILIIISKGLYAQRVGIGTASPDVSAQLHIESTDKGLLVPRVNLTSLTAAAPVASPAFGLVVFNTNGALPGGYGLFYWNGLGWLKLQTADGGWNVSGNSFQAGDYPVLGSLTNKPLRFIMNGVPAGFTDSSNTHVGFKAGMQRTTAKNTVAIGNAALFVNTTIGGLVAIGDSALYNNGAGVSGLYEGEANTAVGFNSLKQNMIGGDNTAVGYETLKNNNGFSNTAIGTLAMKYVVDGNNNTGLGSYALGTMVTGSYNTAVGSFSLAFNKNDNNTAVGFQSLMYNSADVSQGHLAINNNAFGNQTLYSNRTGANNVGMGDFSLYSNRTGNNNVALGYRTGYSNTGSGNVFIGNTAGLFARSDNKLYIENTTVDSNNALIYGDFAADSVKLNAKVIVRDILQVKGSGAFIDNANLWAYSPGLPSASPLLIPPVSGEGRRMMWFAEKAAFRAGYASSTYWNAENIGVFSFATGYDTRASGYRSAAFGSNTTASGDDALTAGAGTIASGNWSVAMGNSTTASSNYSMAIGNNSRAQANGAFASGSASVASGVYATAMGNRAHASKYAAVAIGDSARAFGDGAVALGYYSMALNNYSAAIGFNNKAYGEGSFAAGAESEAHASGSISMGAYSRTTGTGAFAVGESTVARAFNSMSIGLFNDSAATADRFGPALTNPLFVVGNGTADNARRNAFVVYYNGNADANGYVRIGRPAGGSPDFAGIENGYGVAGKQADAGKIQYGGFGGGTHQLNIVGGGTSAGGSDRVIKLWSEGGLNVRGSMIPDVDNSYSLGQSGRRWSVVWAGNGVIQTSDARLKTNIASLDYGLKELLQMKPVRYNWKKDPQGNKEIGFLAQDILQLIPEAVEVPSNGDAMGMKYTELIPVLVKAIQEQQKQIDELKKLLQEKIAGN